MNKFTAAVFTFVMALSMSVGMNAGNTALAWDVSQTASAYCGQNGNAWIDWTFTNEEPDEDKWSMELVVTDQQSGETASVSVPAQHNAGGTLDTGLAQLEDGTVSFKLTWTDGRSGVDTRYANYHATEDCTPPEVCEYDDQILADDPNCQPPEVCEYDDQILADDPNCQEPEVCEYDDSILADDPNCQEPEVCEYNDQILADDANCVAPEVCEYDDTLLADDEDCKEDEGNVLPETVTQLPNTGIASSLLSALSIGGLTGGTYAFVRSRKNI